MKRTISTFLITIISLVVLGLLSNKVQYNKPVIRDIELTHKEVDYQSFFNDLKDQEINLDRSKNTIEYKATKELDANLFNEVNFVNYAPNKNKVEFDYQMKYDANKNKFNLSISAKTDKGKVIDNWEGTPFVKENKDIDIVFATDNGLIYLSDLEAKGLINNCGWFSKLFRKIAKVAIVVAAIATVVAIAVVAAPVIAGAIPALAGGALALSGGAAASAMTASAVAATAVATTTFAVATTTALTASIVAGISLAVDKISDKIATYNAINKSKKITQNKIKAILKEAIKDNQKKNKKTVVYLGRNPEYIYVANNDRENRVIYFYLDEYKWSLYYTNYTIECLWLINEAFLNFCYYNELNNNWQFRLTTDYWDYLTPRSLTSRGGFYSSELNFLKNKGHYFSKFKENNLYFKVYLNRNYL